MILITDYPFRAKTIGLGNKLSIYMFNRLLAEQTNYALFVPRTVLKCHSGPEVTLQFEMIDGNVVHNLQGFDDSITTVGTTIHTLANDLLESSRGGASSGYYLRYDYIKPYKSRVKEIYAPLWKDTSPRKSGEVAIMLRNSMIDPTFTVPIEYYTSILDTLSITQLYYSAEKPSLHTKLLEALAPYNPIFIEGNSMERLVTLAGFETLITCQGTYGFWAGLMSEATRVYAPLTTHGPNKTTDPMFNLIVDDEERYTYIPIDNPPELMRDYK